jgi:hypothetical protein
MTWPIKNPCDECNEPEITKDCKLGGGYCSCKTYYSGELAGAKATLEEAIRYSKGWPTTEGGHQYVTVTELNTMLEELDR